MQSPGSRWKGALEDVGGDEVVEYEGDEKEETTDCDRFHAGGDGSSLAGWNIRE